MMGFETAEANYRMTTVPALRPLPNTRSVGLGWQPREVRRSPESARGCGISPACDKIWMLFGFELFLALKGGLTAEIIEVYPFAIVRALTRTREHKSTEQGYRDQLAAVAGRTGLEPLTPEAQLKATVPGSRHDRLDAYMAAWVATLAPQRPRAFG